MEITEKQKQAVVRWVEQGLSLADIQKYLAQEFDISMTYMDVRFLVDDLNLAPLDKSQEKGSFSSSSLDIPLTALDSSLAEDEQEEKSLGSVGISRDVSVEVDPIKKLGSIISGSVTFSDGMKAEWFIDQIGRLGLNPKTPDYKPTPEDLQAFQEQLQSMLQQKGF